MKMVPVTSSNIEAIGFANGTMKIVFSGGKSYIYEGVSADLFEQFKKAESFGKFFSEHIRPKFKGVKL